MKATTHEVAQRAAEYDTINLNRPGWMGEETWTQVVEKVQDKLEELVEIAEASDAVTRIVAAAPTGGCTERSWCTLGPTSEHKDSHAGDPIELADFNKTSDLGWCGRLSEERGKSPRFTIEGRYVSGDDEPDRAPRVARLTAEFDAADLAMLLWAIGTPTGRAGLDGALDAVAAGGQ